MISVQHDGYVSFGKRHEPEKMARGQALENLPYGMGGEPGPSAWRDTGPNPSDRAVAARIKGEVARDLAYEARKPWYRRRMSRRRARELSYKYDQAQRLESNGSQQ